MKRALVLIFMTEEEPVTAKAVASVLPQLTHQDHLFILHNGAKNIRFRHKYEGLPRTSYFESETNRGVAGGRNFLLNQPGVLSSDFVFLIDSDAIAPSDYLDRLGGVVMNDPSIGVAGPVVLDHHKIKDDLRASNVLATHEELDAEYYDIACGRLHDLFGKHLDSRLADHIGTNSDWREAYLENADAAQEITRFLGLRGEHSFSVGLKFDAEALAALREGDSEIEVTNIAGCGQVFRTELLRDLGPLYDLYSPYGHEDVDFSMRSLRAGKRNITTSSAYLIHRTDERHSARTQLNGLRRKRTNESRVRTIFEYRWAPDSFPFISYRRVMRRMFSTWLRQKEAFGEALDLATAEMRGLQQAFNQLALEEGHDFGTRFATGLQSIGPDFGAYNLLSPEALKAAGLEEEASARRNRLSVLKPGPRTKQNPTGRFDLADASSTRASIDNFDSRKGRHPGQRIDQISDDERSKLASFKNLHKGERCFIIGNGPSLKKTDFNLLRDEITIGVNGIFYMFDDIGFVPTYYTVEDNHVVDDNLERIVSIPSKAKFFPSKYKNAIGGAENHFFLPTDWQFYYKSTPHFETPRFSQDVSEIAYVGQTVTYLNMQLAHHMGFDEVYLIGVDFDYKVPESSKIDGFTIVSQEDDPNHFHPAYFGKGKKWHFPKLENCEKVYRHAREVYESTGRLLADATIGGKLEVYEKVDFYGLFDEPLLLSTPNKPLISLIRSILMAEEQPRKVVVEATDLGDLSADLDVISRYKSPQASAPRLRVLDKLPSDQPRDGDIDIFVGAELYEDVGGGRHVATPMGADLNERYAELIVLGDLVVGLTGEAPAIISEGFRLKDSPVMTEHMNPLMALSIAGAEPTGERTVSTDIFPASDNVFGLPGSASIDRPDYSLVAALVEMNKPVALKNNRIFFPA